VTSFPIEAERVTKMFGTFTAVDALSFQAGAGEILVFLGPNGAGKTTLFKMIMGLLRPTAGRIRIGDDEIASERKTIKPLIGYMSQRFSLYPLLTGIENVEFMGGVSGLSSPQIRRKKAEIESQIPADILRLKVQDIPAGFRQKIAFFTCLMTGPKIILLDEPTAGAGPALRRSIWADIRDLKTAGRTILVATHHLGEAEQADQVLILDHGRIILKGRPRDLARLSEGRTMYDVYREALGHEPRN
jgi:ABC-2 type transport system ATP-binding protein